MLADDEIKAYALHKLPVRWKSPSSAALLIMPFIFWQLWCTAFSDEED
ncbi:MAG: hypothetical protein ABSD73_06720 [Candidatus Bathyarchaeia archaeon]